MKPFVRSAFKVLIILLIIPALVGIYWLWLIFRFDKPYHRIARGDSEARVVALLGKPYSVSAEHDTLTESWWQEDGFGIAQCEIVKQYRYRVPVITGDEYIIGFDSGGRAVLKNQMTSP